MKKICLFLALVTVLTSCVRDVVLDAMEDPLLAVYCVLKVDSVQELKLSYAKSAAMTEAPRVTGATAVLTDLTEDREAGRFVQVADSLWQLEYSAIPTHSYRLEVTVPGKEPVWAEQTMPAEPPVESETKLIEGDRRSVKTEGYGYRFTKPCTTWISVEGFDRMEGYSVLYAPVGELCTDYPYVDDFNLTGKVWERDLNEPMNPFVKLVADRYYLSGYPLHRDFLRIPKAEEQKQSFFRIDGDIKTSVMTGGTGGEYKAYSYVYFSALSDDYDSYLRDAYQQYYAEVSEDLSSIYLRENLHGNIHGGIGIFGAASTIRFYRMYSWGLPWQNQVLDEP
ncbi:MAG: DUF4249 family protein [Bacteroidales bacterium]|nr:DUF4249 family protein [Bacteroidales bacterium]